MKQRFHLLIGLLLLTVLILSACGGGSARQRVSEESSAATADTAAQEEAAAAEEEAAAGDSEVGKELFAGTCSACHGPEGEGVEGLGKDMTASEFIAEKSNEELIEFIKQGRDPSHPLNTTGVAMPPKGGNPSLGDEDLQDIVAYIRTIHE